MVRLTGESWVPLISAIAISTWLTSVVNASGLRLADRYKPRAEVNTTQSNFNWNSIQPTSQLRWEPCYSTFECARFEVPLDYAEPSGRKADIAMIRIPAQVPWNSTRYKGPVLINPGGPGASGVDNVRSFGDTFTKILGPEFDVIGFDPRGISRSSPRVSFFATDVERALYRNAFPVINNGRVEISRPWADYHLYAKLANTNDDGYLKHINTENTATDMVKIVEAHGREKLQFWGFSYGSVLGATYAAMYPDKVERLVIDGVVDAEAYYATSWLNDTVDSKKTLSMFFENCAAAGPDHCEFYSPDPEDIRHNLNSLFEKVRREPIVVEVEDLYGVVDESVIRQVVFGLLYRPLLWGVLAAGLKAAVGGDGLIMLMLATPTRFNCSRNPHEHDFDNLPFEGFVALACNDGDKVSPSLADSQAYFDELVQVSDWADILGRYRLGCVGWPNKKKGFRGPFVTNTSHPLLIVGNTADPTTPLRNAKKMSQGFLESVLLTQDSPGHVSLNNPSTCTQMHIRTYFQNGTLPESGTVCQPDLKNTFLAPLGGSDGSAVRGSVRRDDRTVEDDLRDAIATVPHKFSFSFPFSL